jgi:Bacterial protein of unknown function (DUF899)
MPKRRRSGERQRSAKGSAFSRTDSSLEQLDEIPSSLHSGLMAFETIEGILRQTRLTDESAEYRARREELRLAEIDLMQRRERVAELRRRLPLGAAIQDYVFQEGPADLNAGDSPNGVAPRAAPSRAVRFTVWDLDCG